MKMRYAMLVLVLVVAARAGEPVDWKKRENHSTDTAKKRVNNFRDDVKRNNWHFNVNHTNVVEHVDRTRVNTYINNVWYRRVTNVHEVNDLGLRLYRINNQTRTTYVKEHPNVLPVLKHPGPMANSFDWSKILKDPEIFHPLSQQSWAVAAVEALEWNYLMQNGKSVHASVQPVLDLIPAQQQKEHASAGLAFEFLLRHGTALEARYPTGKPMKGKTDIPFPIKAAAWGYVHEGDKPAPVEAIKKALVQHGPLVVSMYASPHFEAYSGGLYDEKYMPTKPGGHANHYVILTGWDDAKKAWHIRNTWGNDWGENGYAWIPFGANNIGAETLWVDAASTHYKLPQSYYEALNAKPR